MKKFTLTVMANLAALLLTACGGIPTEKEVTASDVEISGFLKDYVKVVDGSYKFTNDGDNGYISFKLELIAQPSGTYCAKSYGVLKVNPVTADGQILDAGHYGFETNDTELNKIKDLLTSNVGDTKNISFTWDYCGLSMNNEIASKIFNEATTFEVIDEAFTTDCDDSDYTSSSDDTDCDDSDYTSSSDDSDCDDSDYTSSSDDSDSDDSDSDDSSEWDSVIAQYEDYMDQYIKLLKKANAGDMDALTEYGTMLQKAQSLQNKLSSASGNLTPAQVAKFNKITQKLASAASSL